MLKAAGAVLVVFSCAALGYSKSVGLSKRLRQLREIEKMVFLLLGEITYRREALPEALQRVAKKCGEPLAGFLQEVSDTAVLYQGERFSGIFREKVQKHMEGSGMVQKDMEEFAQLGECLGYLDITMQKDTAALYLEQLKKEIEGLSAELPGKQKLYQSMGVLGGMFLSIILL